MVFTQTKLQGAFIIDVEKKEDSRGFFARAWCKKEFKEHGLNTRISQCNLAVSHRKGTLRGMHFQDHPYEEAKLVRCTRGAVFDVIIDLRPESKTFRKWIGVELTADSHRMLYVREGFAHGYQTLVDNTELVYQVSEFYQPKTASGVRYNDPAFGIEWPMSVEVISDQDRNWPDFVD